MTDKNVLAIVGSLRSASLNGELAELAREAAPAGVTVTVAAGIDRLPFYNEDLDGGPGVAPAAVTALRDQVDAADAILLVAPPNNGTISAVLKNVIDWASRPYGDSALTGVPVAVTGVGHRLDTTFADAGRAATIAGADYSRELTAEFPISQLTDGHPRGTVGVVERLGELLGDLTGAPALAR